MRENNFSLQLYMKELEQAIKILKKVYLRQDKINDETMKLLKYIYTLEKAYDILNYIKEV